MPTKTISNILSASGAIATGLDVTLFLKSGSVMLVMKSYADAFITLFTDGLDAAKLAFKAAGQIADKAVEALVDATRVAKLAQAAGKVLEVVGAFGIIADGAILAFSIYDEAQQRDALRDAINQLYVSRIISKLYDHYCSSINTLYGLCETYMMLAPGSPYANQAAANTIANRIATFLQDEWKTIDIPSTYDELIWIDKARPTWTNEDPSRDSAIAQAGQGAPSPVKAPPRPPVTKPQA